MNARPRFLHLGLVILLLAALACKLFACHPITAARLRFDPESAGLVMIETMDKYGKGDIRRYAVAPGETVMEIDGFTPDETRAIYTVNCFTMKSNRMTYLSMTDEDGNELPVTREVNHICQAMREIDHDVTDCRIFYAGAEIFVSVLLNVNLWTPNRFYYYNQETEKLVWLCTFANRDVTAIRVVSRDRLAALRQESIGGALPPDPEAYFYSHRPTFQIVADMLFSHGDLFTEYERLSRKSYIQPGAMEFESLSAVLWPYADKMTHHFTEEDQKTLSALTAFCLPYRITYVSGNENACPALIFEFSVFRQEEQRQKDCCILCLPQSEDERKRLNTLQSLAEQCGDLSETGYNLWYIAFRDPRFIN